MGSSSSYKFSFILPYFVFFPTAQTIISPEPSIILDPEIKNGFAFDSLEKIFGIYFFIVSDSPVI